MKRIITSVVIFISFSLNASAEKISATDFFSSEANKKEAGYAFNPYETLFSGVIAFVIGNVGFYSTKSSILKLGYSGVQTIGVINFGKGLYNINAPNLERELAQSLSSQNNNPNISKEYLSQKLIQIYAKEDRAKRIALFYGSSLLSTQYLINAFIGNTPKEIKNIYVFLGGINLLIAGYASTSKTNYEKYYFGDNFDIRPTIVIDPESLKKKNAFTKFLPALQLTLSF